MSAEAISWHDEHLLDHRRRLRNGMFVSMATHGLIVAIFAASPPQPMAPAPTYLAVELVAAPRPAAPPATAGGKPKAAAPRPPEPAAAPPPPPPVTKAPVQVLPEETPGKIRKAPPEPAKVVAKAEPKASPAPRRRRREKELSFDDAMAALEEELGGDETADLLVPRADDSAQAAEESSAVPSSRKGVTLTPEEAAWDREVIRLIQNRFPDLSRFRGRGLETTFMVEVSASGSLKGEPRLIQTSGNLDFDRIVLAIVERAAPLPPPPRPWTRRLSLSSDR